MLYHIKSIVGKPDWYLLKEKKKERKKQEEKKTAWRKKKINTNKTQHTLLQVMRCRCEQNEGRW